MFATMSTCSALAGIVLLVVVYDFSFVFGCRL